MGSDGWLDELAVLRRGAGPVRRMAARSRVIMTDERVRPGDPDHSWAIDVLAPSGHLRPAASHIQVALYPLDARRCDLPVVIVDVPPGGIQRRLAQQGGEVDVRGVPEPGHAVVLVFDDGRRVDCQYPAEPPSPLGARHRWGFRAGPGPRPRRSS